MEQTIIMPVGVIEESTATGATFRLTPPGNKTSPHKRTGKGGQRQGLRWPPLLGHAERGFAALRVTEQRDP